MTPDLLDDLLDLSAPATRAAEQSEIGAMIRESRAIARPRRTRRGLAIGGGVLAVLIVSGAGVAAATDGFTWVPWLQDPIGTYSFSTPDGLDCIVRVAHYTAADAAVADGVNLVVEDWWRSKDVAAAALPLVPSMIDRIRASENTVYIAETGETVPGGFGTKWYDADQEYDLAFSNAIGELEGVVLREHGYTPEKLGEAGLEGGYGVQCLDENGQVTTP